MKNDGWLNLKRLTYKTEACEKLVEVDVKGKMVDIDPRVFAFVCHDAAPGKRRKWWRVIELRTRTALVRAGDSETEVIEMATEIISQFSDSEIADMLDKGMTLYPREGGEKL